MKRSLLYFLIVVALSTNTVLSQADSVNRLEEVVVTDAKLYKHSKTQQVSVLKDSVLRQNEPSLTSLLKFNSVLYFRENGYGMVSSPSFRGTSASQTAVVWNGININSQLNGQTDFNAINTSGFDNIAVRGGGGSVLYGSGAIGGSIHLNNNFNFNKDFDNSLNIEAGSFETFNLNYSGAYSSKKASVYYNFSGTTSENDYKYLGSDKRNENGDYYNVGLHTGFAYWLNDTNILKLHSSFTKGDRGFSGTLLSKSNSKYEDKNSRNLLEWKAFYNRFTSSLKLAYIEEAYNYFENRESDIFTKGVSNSLIGRYNLGYDLNESSNIAINVDYQKTSGSGSNLEKHSRETISTSLLFSQQLKRFTYELSARQEFNDRYKSPFLFAAGGNYEVTESYAIRVNLSRNFRIPTYNDLFWSNGGNKNLRPESSWQAEIGNKILIQNLELGAIFYWLEIEDLLRWMPSDNGVWRPQNTAQTRNLGVEFRGSWKEHFGKHHLALNTTYAYTRTKDLSLKKVLIYTPEHKSTVNIGYSLKDFSAFYQFLHIGSIYTSTDNNYHLDGYQISNLGFGYNFGNHDFLKFNFEIRNLFNANYQSLPSRPMPGRSINTSLTFKF